MSSLGSITVLSLFAAVISAQAADTMKAFSPAEEGMVRFVLQVPKQEDESLFKVELIVGKVAEWCQPVTSPSWMACHRPPWDRRTPIPRIFPLEQ